MGTFEPTVIGRAVPTAPDSIWPLQLAVHHLGLFTEGAIHPNRPHERLHPDGAWRLIHSYEQPEV